MHSLEFSHVLFLKRRDFFFRDGFKVVLVSTKVSVDNLLVKAMSAEACFAFLQQIFVISQ